MIGVESIFRDQESLCAETREAVGLKEKLTRLSLLSVAGFMVYGFLMGIDHSILQALSSAVKLPFLFGATLAITLPAFHFISLHLGSRMRFSQTLVLVMHGVAVSAVLLVALVPIALFFILNRSSYGFLILMHVAFVGFACLSGVGVIARSLRQLAKSDDRGFDQGEGWCLAIWVVLYVFVGCQMSYLLRPFLGAQDEFTFINTEPGNFYTAVVGVIKGILFG